MNSVAWAGEEGGLAGQTDISVHITTSSGHEDSRLSDPRACAANISQDSPAGGGGWEVGVEGGVGGCFLAGPLSRGAGTGWLRFAVGRSRGVCGGSELMQGWGSFRQALPFANH